MLLWRLQLSSGMIGIVSSDVMCFSVAGFQGEAGSHDCDKAWASKVESM